ncbi:MAG: hypothetical protein ACOYI8_00675 [Christensenellales bacterium]|jgi:hypothetical protein
MLADDILRLHAIWDENGKQITVQNLEALFSVTPMTYFDRARLMGKITSSSEHTAQAWLNLGRMNVKIPLIKLCRIAQFFGISVDDLLRTNTSWLTEELKIRLRKKIASVEF